MNTAKGFFVTGTDTGVGKTWVAAGLLSALAAQGYRTAAYKPIACGCNPSPAGLRNEDALLLLQHATLKTPYEQVNPYAFAAPIAPHLAALTESRPIDIGAIKQCFNILAQQADYVIVEGVGGWQVPLNAHETSADLALALGLPVILVVGLRLGCLNHALLSYDSICRHGASLAGWVANSIDPAFDEAGRNIEALKERIPAPYLGHVPYLAEFDAGTIARHLAVQESLIGKVAAGNTP